MTAKQFIAQGFNRAYYEYDRETKGISTKPFRLVADRFENGRWVEHTYERGADGKYHRVNTDDVPTVS